MRCYSASRLLTLLFCAWLLPATANSTGLSPQLLEQTSDFIQLLTRTNFIQDGELGAAESDYRFYQGRDYRPAWLDGNGLRPEAQALLKVLDNASSEGLQAADYHALELGRLLEIGDDSLLLARLDLLLSDAFFLYAHDVRSGRISPRRIDSQWKIAQEAVDWPQFLQTALDAGNFATQLQELPPYQSGYRRLRRELARYRAIAEGGGWPQLAAGPLLLRGVREPRVVSLRQRLRASGDLLVERDGDAQLFDASVERAVKTFQKRHGLAVNGRVDDPTRQAMNVPAAQRLQQLLIAMERWRWLPRHLGRRHLLVNVPGYTLYAMDTAQTAFSMRVIIGKAYRQTPSVRTAMTDIIVNPYWYVPKTILREDILPRIKRDPGYLRRANIQVLSSLDNGGQEVVPEQVDWQQLDADNFPYILRQQPGERNALGRIKFRLADSNGIYLHDTPNNKLFERRVRAYSSGCIRLEEPLKLAAFVLQDDADWNRAGVEKVLAEGTPRRIDLPEPLPVLMVYWTAWVDDDGLLQFRDDIYGRDRLLEQALIKVEGSSAS